jgi:Uri superfamily endonuclease
MSHGADFSNQQPRWHIEFLLDHHEYYQRAISGDQCVVKGAGLETGCPCGLNVNAA